jgi:hypothetical protein
LVDIPIESASACGYVGQTLRAYLYAREGRRIKDIPTVFYERRAGASKMSMAEAIRGSFAILQYRLFHRRTIRR